MDLRLRIQEAGLGDAGSTSTSAEPPHKFTRSGRGTNRFCAMSSRMASLEDGDEGQDKNKSPANQVTEDSRRHRGQSSISASQISTTILGEDIEEEADGIQGI